MHYMYGHIHLLKSFHGSYGVLSIKKFLFKEGVQPFSNFLLYNASFLAQKPFNFSLL